MDAQRWRGGVQVPCVGGLQEWFDSDAARADALGRCRGAGHVGFERGFLAAEIIRAKRDDPKMPVEPSLYGQYASRVRPAAFPDARNAPELAALDTRKPA